MADKANRIFRKLCGHPCWNPRRGYGSALLLEFGRPTLKLGKILDPVAAQRVGSRQSYRRRIVDLRGEWSMLVDCCGWRLVQTDSELARWTSSKRKIDIALLAFEGQILSNIEVDREKLLTTFEFDLGGKLHTFPYSDETEDHWTIYQSGSSVLSFGANGIQS